MAIRKRRTDYTPGFLRWWDAYPIDRRRGKAQSFELWVELELEPRTDELVEKLENLIATTWRTMDRKYIKTAFYYLKHERHEDDLIPVDASTIGETRLSEKGLKSAEAAKNVLASYEIGETGFETRRISDVYDRPGQNG